MAGSVSSMHIKSMRAIVGPEPSDMDLIRYLHLAKCDVAMAVNLYFDTATSFRRSADMLAAETPRPEARHSTPPAEQDVALPETPMCDPLASAQPGQLARTPAPVTPSLAASGATKASHTAVARGSEWLLLGEADVEGYSTCKGAGKIFPGDPIVLNFPKQSLTGDKKSVMPRGPFKPSRAQQAGADIVRFSSERSGELGRLPGDWARSLVPLVANKWVHVEAECISAPQVIAMMDTVVLRTKLFVQDSLFKKAWEPPTSAGAALEQQSTVKPLSTILKLLGLKPFQKADFTPEEFFTRKRALALDGTALQVAGPAKRPSLAMPTTGSNPETGGDAEAEPVLSDGEVSKLVGTTDRAQLEEMEPPESLLCDLRSYQKQALKWMSDLENGAKMEDAARTLHPCWEAYRLADEKQTIFYHNVFSGEATMAFPSALQMARGGILADAMGLGKTVMTIALLLANPGRGDVSGSTPGCNPSAPSAALPGEVTGEAGTSGRGREDGAVPLNMSFGKLGKRSARRGPQKGAGTLIVCPMTLLGQWKAECEAHSKPGVLSVYIYYGNDRAKEKKALLEHDIIITTYGVLASETNQENFLEEGPIHSLHWFRIVLDEAHSIKNCTTQSAKAVFQLTADRRWALSGTPIQNQLQDIFALLHFLRVEPWCNWGWWTKLIQKPYEEGDERSLRLLQGILRPLMLRRTKDTLDALGRPILELPPTDVQVVQCELTEAERDFYDALYKKSKVKFDNFVEQGRVLHNYASILELLLRLRQCCDHPFLVLSRGDTQEFADADKLVRRIQRPTARSNGAEGEGASNGGANALQTAAFVADVAQALVRGDKQECPICLEIAEDAVVTPCAHVACRECLLASWPSGAAHGSCPICRQRVARQDLITAPKDSRFQLDVEKNWVESAKVAAMLKHLEQMQASGQGEKCIIFSQWTSFLDLLEIPLKRSKFKFVRLDGSLSQPQREKTIHSFSKDPSIMVMLISLKAGGVGINLTAASHCLILDPWWNPAVEEQAIMRVHRIGQKRNVTVRHFIVKNSVEERMLAVQARKQRLVSGALTDQEVRSSRIEELKMLFR